MSKDVMKQTLSVAALMVASAFSSQAHAQDWSGPHVGVSGGYGDATADAYTVTTFSSTGYFASTSVPAINAVGRQNMKPHGAIAGIDAGYDFQNGNLVFGFSGDISKLFATNGHQTGTAPYPCCAPTNFTVAQNAKMDTMATLQGRVGLNFGNNSGHDMLLYVTGGYATAKVKYTSLFTYTFATAHEAAQSSKWMGGFVVGAGADFQMGGHWSMRPELLYANFGSTKVAGDTLTAFSPAISFPSNIWGHKVNVTDDIVRVSFDYHF
jgi:outer membrane immunogenic protein